MGGGWSECPEFSPHHANIADAYNGSLYAAKALHEAVLPISIIWDQSHSYFGYEFSILVGEDQFDGCSKDTPASAWLIAIIKALIAGCDD